MKTLALLASLFVAASSAMAADAPDAPDDKALVNFLSDYVYQLEQPVYVYNWFNSQGRDPIWAQSFSSDSSIGYDHYLSMSRKYWESFCSKNSAINPSDCAANAFEDAKQYGQGNMFGPGLYAAVDPVATSSYGGSQDGWVLMQMHLPKGLRIMDLRRDGSIALPIRVEKILTAYKCPNEWNDVQNALNNMLAANNLYEVGYFYSNSGQQNIQLADECLLELRKVLKDNLKLDAIFYSYGSTMFQECELPTPAGQTPSTSENNPFRQGAFVIASGTSLQPSDVRVFNPNTKDDLEERVRIQSLFYKADVDSPTFTYQSYFSAMKFPNYPNYLFGGVTQNCNYINGVASCKNQIYLYPNGGGSSVTIDPPSWPTMPTLPTTISASHPPASNQLTGTQTLVNGQWVKPSQKLLWADLDGQAIAPDLSTFIKTDLFGCQATREYDAADQ